MSPSLPTPEDAADDALAERLADAVVDGAAHDAAMRRLALRAMGHFKQPCDCTVDELAAQHGTDRHTLNRIALRALTKLRLSPEISCLKIER